VRIILIEPYYAGSHRSWADGWVANSRHDIELLHHEADFWRWRMRGSAVTLAEELVASIEAHGPPDVLVVSDMIDLPVLLGFARRSLPASVPVVLYMHENQLLYPLGPAQQPDDALALVNWKSVAAADATWFNSHFHRDGFFTELPRLLHRMPDRRHEHLVAATYERSSVHPIGVDVADLIAARRDDDVHSDGPLVLWNQRWDHDKNPGAVFRALVKIAAERVPFRLALAGENQRVDPREFAWVQEQLGSRVVHVGHLPSVDYRALLLRSDIVVSAARHEFFGIAIVEAIAAGAVPVLPNRLSFPEVVPAEWHTAALYPEGELRQRLIAAMRDLPGSRVAGAGLREVMGRFDWSLVAAEYDDAAEEFSRQETARSSESG